MSKICKKCLIRKASETLGESVEGHKILLCLNCFNEWIGYYRTLDLYKSRVKYLTHTEWKLQWIKEVENWLGLVEKVELT